jgi:PAS domain S-box-containing protein
MAVFLFDRQGNRVFVNDEGVALIGESCEEVLKGRFGDCLVEEDRERAKETFCRCTEYGEPVRGLEVRLLADGGVCHTTSSNLTPVKDEAGEVMGVQVTVQDITGQVETREALRRSNELYRSLIDSTGGSVIRVRRDGTRGFVSDSTPQFFGDAREEWLVGRFGDHMVPEDRERAWDLLQETFRTGEGVRNLVSRQHVNGELRHISANWEPIRDSEGSIVEVQTTSFDVTERERLREALREYSTRLARSHEEERLRISRALHDQTIQTLLALANNIGNDLVRGEMTERVKARLGQVRSVLLDEVEELRRLCRGLRPAILDRMGLEEAVRWFVRQTCQEAGVEGTVEVGGENGRLHPVVEVRLFRIVQEAVNNAVRHGQPQKVEVKLEREDGRLRLEVKDDGRGFEPPESYVQLVEKGRLGLMGMAERARSVGAEVRIESQPGDGSRVLLSGDTQKMDQAVV